MKQFCQTILFFSFSFFSTLNTVAQVPDYVPLDGLVGWWPFNGNANDQSNFSNNGTAFGPVLTTDRFGNSNSAYNFDGINDYIEVIDDASLRVANISMSVWFYANTTAVKQIIYKGNRTNASNEAYSINSTLHTALKINSGCLAGQGWRSCNFGQSLTTFTWTNVIVTYDGNTIKDYVNGVLVNSCTQIGSIDACVGGNLRFGFNYAFSVDLGHPFNGKLDDIGLWNRALNECEIQQVYRAKKDLVNTSVTQTGNQIAADFITADGYQWLDCNNNFQPILNETNFNLSSVNSGSYAVEISYLNCKDTSECLIAFPTDTCNFDFDFNDYFFCKGSNQFYLPDMGMEWIYKYTDLNGNIVSKKVDSLLFVGSKLEYIVNVVFFMDNCVAIDTFTIELIENNVISKIELTSINSNNYLFNGCCGTSYLWSEGSLFNDSTLQNPTTELYESSWIYLEVTDSSGCKAHDSIWIEINQNVPNIITPNSDGLNDYFIIKGMKIDVIQIFNRWGRMVYETENYQNNWNGENVPDGMYYYLFQSDNQNYKGWLQIIR